jgi:hypothetical protein
MLSKGLKLVKATLIVAWLSAVLALAMVLVVGGESSAEEPLAIGVDADPAGNTATSLGPIDPCVSVSEGDTFDVDLFITGVEALRAWEAYFSFDGGIVTVVDLDVNMFQAANEGSNVFNGSQALPVDGDLFRIGAVDIGSGAEPNSGSGVLARLTLEAISSGLSPALLPIIDENEDGTIDLGTRLSNAQFEAIGDTSGDPYFDGPITEAQIAVDMPCPAAPTPTAEATPEATPIPATASPADGATAIPTAVGTASPTGTAAPSSPAATAPATPGASPTATPAASDDGGTDWSSGGFIVAYVVGGGVAVLLLGGTAFAIARRRSR